MFNMFNESWGFLYFISFYIPLGCAYRQQLGMSRSSPFFSLSSLSHTLTQAHAKEVDTNNAGREPGKLSVLVLCRIPCTSPNLILRRYQYTVGMSQHTNIFIITGRQCTATSNTNLSHTHTRAQIYIKMLKPKFAHKDE